ncbi:hypothetical protein ATCC51561_1850 [Campylobacter concisus ATCC 51561]|nr:hypothetical protein ATCC51561_1850 [Campylobacter concisus ATCC 51561]
MVLEAFFGSKNRNLKEKFGLKSPNFIQVVCLYRYQHL